MRQVAKLFDDAEIRLLALDRDKANRQRLPILARASFC
jgi:hypothetical protein